jgi:arylsulfatase A-like enzyme
MLNYYNSVNKFDVELSAAIYQLDVRNLLDNTIIIVTSDNGMPFPRGKATCYDAGLRVPLVIIWPKYMQGGRISDEFINLSDLAPTILEAAGLSSPPEMTAVSFFDLLVDSLQPPERGASPGKQAARSDQHCEGIIRDAVFVERERHALGRGGDTNSLGTLSYPIRGVLTKEFLYLVNFRPHLWPACDPPKFNDIDPSPSKTNVLNNRFRRGSLSRYFELSCGLRPREELYDMRNDPYQLNNLAADSAYQEIKQKLWRRLHQWMIDTNDPRANGEDDRWDNYGWNPVLEKPKRR